MSTYTDLKSEEFIYIGTKLPDIKKPLKKCLKTIKLAIEAIE